MKYEMPEIGKISAEIFDSIILPHLGRRRKEVIVGPMHGVDVGIVELSENIVMALTTDPVFIVPEYGWERSAWFAVHILASDAATSGLRPAYMTVDLNLPISMHSEEFKVMWMMMHEECEKLGIAIVAGHTGRYHGCSYPMVGGATVISIGRRDSFVTPRDARAGDLIIITKGAAIEASGLFAVTFYDKIASVYGEGFAKEAEAIFYEMSVVEDALTAVEVGVRDHGVTAMHDATECGVIGGLYEIAEASNVGMIVDKDKIIVKDSVRKICELFQIDPYISISEGTLIITVRPHRAKEVVQRLSNRGITSSIVGEILPREKGIHIMESGVEKKLEHPRVDPFWAAFERELMRARGK